MENASKILPKWYRETEIFYRIKPLLIMEGNVFDKYIYPSDLSILRLGDYLAYFFQEKGYQNVVFYDTMLGFSNPADPDMVTAFAKLVQVDDEHIVEDERTGGRNIPAAFSGNSAMAPELVSRVLNQEDVPSVVIMDFASRYIPDPERLQQSEVMSFTRLQKGVIEAAQAPDSNGKLLRNLVILLVNKVNDLPSWFYLSNPMAKTIFVDTPSSEERRNFVKGPNFESFFDADIYKAEIHDYDDRLEDLDKIQERFIGLTEGFSFTAMEDLTRLCQQEKFHIKDMCRSIDLYKFGITENPWEKLDYDDIKNAKSFFTERVKGQDYAVEKVLTVVRRAMTGMSGLQHSGHGKPKGVLFFAGPTGTGKTELAKTLAAKIFGDESSCIRFDMSEFSQSQSDQRLLGAPPGYVGYEAGGQLTNAVKKNPFSILLFDEIEKAHPSILDKFLQILEDGRMTDGQGNTVYFSECIIIFTSNLGFYRDLGNGIKELQVSQDESYDVVQKKVRRGVEEYFKNILGRPEILNRIGENICELPRKNPLKPYLGKVCF